MKFINTDTGKEIKPTCMTNSIVVIDGELWEISFGTQEDEDTLRDGWAWKIKQPFKIIID